jgi:predicted anti-sigma-YlaC factor YlaD
MIHRLWRNSVVFSCRQATRLASERLDRRLNAFERVGLAIHLAMCGACRACARQFRTINHLARSLLRSTESPDSTAATVLSPAAKLRMTEAMRRARQEQ